MSEISVVLNSQEMPIQSISGLKVTGKANFTMTILISGEPAATGSSISFICYSKPNREVLITTKCSWQRVSNNQSAKIFNNSNFFLCSIKDLGLFIEAVIVPAEEEFHGEYKIVYGPIVLDPEISKKFELLKYSHSLQVQVEAQSNFTDKDLSMVELFETKVVGYDHDFKPALEIQLSRDLIFISVPNELKKAQLFNAKKQELNISFKTETDLDIFMLLFEYWKSKLEDVHKDEAEKNNEFEQKQSLFARLDSIKPKKSQNLNGLPNEILSINQENSAGDSLMSLSKIFHQDGKTITPPKDNKIDSESKKNSQENRTDQTPLKKVEENKTTNNNFTSFSNFDPSIKNVFRKIGETNTEKKPKLFENITQSFSQNGQELKNSFKNEYLQRLEHSRDPQLKKQEPKNIKTPDFSQTDQSKSIKNTDFEEKKEELKKSVGLTASVPLKFRTLHNQNISDKKMFQNTVSNNEYFEKMDTVKSSYLESFPLKDSITNFEKSAKNTLKMTKTDGFENKSPKLAQTFDVTNLKHFENKSRVFVGFKAENEIENRIMDENEKLIVQNKGLLFENEELKKETKRLYAEFEKAINSFHQRSEEEQISRQTKLIDEQLLREMDKKKNELFIREKELKSKLKRSEVFNNEKKEIAHKNIETEFRLRQADLKIEELQKSNEMLNQKLSVQEISNKELKKRLESMGQKEIEELQRRKQIEEENTTKFEKEKKSLNSLIEDMVRSLNEKDEMISSLQKKIDQQSDEIRRFSNQSYTKRNDSQSSLSSKLESQLSVHKVLDKFDDLKIKQESLKKSLRVAQNEKEELAKMNKQLSFENEYLKNRKSADSHSSSQFIDDRLTAIEFEKRRLKNELELSVDVAKNAEGRIKLLKSTLQMSEKNFLGAEQSYLSRISLLNEKISNHEKQKCMLEEQLDQKTKNAIKLELSVENLMKDFERMLASTVIEKTEDLNKIQNSDLRRMILLSFENNQTGKNSKKENQQKDQIESAKLPNEIEKGLRQKEKMSSLNPEIQINENSELERNCEHLKTQTETLNEKLVQSKEESVNFPVQDSVNLKNDNTDDEIYFSFPSPKSAKSLKKDLTQEVLFQLEAKVQSLLNKCFSIMNVSTSKLNGHSVIDQVSITENEIDLLRETLLNLEKEIKILKNKNNSFQEEIEYLQMKVEEVKKKRKGLIEFVKKNVLGTN